jgi:hypothetical protein
MARTRRSEPRIRHGSRRARTWLAGANGAESSLSEDSYTSSGHAFGGDLQQSHIDSWAGARNLAS